MISAVILGGGNGINESSSKALADINGKPMIEYVIDAFKSVEEISKIVVVGPKKELFGILHDKVDEIIEGGGSIIDSIINGIQSVGEHDFVLIASADIPMITKEAIGDFIGKCKKSGADFCYPIVDKKINDQKHPEIKRTYIKTRQGNFTGGNILYINVNEFRKGKAIGQRLFEARKNPVKLASIMGVGAVLGLLTGNLSVSSLEKKFSNALGLRAKAIITEYTEIGNDVDKESDLAYVREYLLDK